MSQLKRVVSEAEVRRLMEKHSSLEARLNELQRRRGLTASEELEVKRIKKEKLMTKDFLALCKREGA